MTRKVKAHGDAGGSSGTGHPSTEAASDRERCEVPMQYHEPSHTSAAWQGPLPDSSKPHIHIVPAAHGYAFTVKAGEYFRVVDLHGSQVVDFMAWVPPYKTSSEHLSMSYTRHAIGGSAPPEIGECLYTNKDEPIFKVIHDPVKTHDMLYMACNRKYPYFLGVCVGHDRNITAFFRVLFSATAWC